MFNITALEKELYRGVMIYDNFLEATDEFVNMAKEEDRWEDAEIIDANGGQAPDIEHRNTRKLSLPPLVDYNPAWYFLAKSLKQMGYRYANTYKAFFQSMEFPQMLYYPADVGYYHDHVDDDVGLERVFSAVLYMNTIEQGGETRFVDLDLTVKPVAGRLLMFPANFLYRHEATMPIGQDKFSVVTWYRMDAG